MRVFAGGREIEIPTDSDGNADVEQIRDAANVPGSRALIRQNPSGQNTVMPRHGRVRISPHDRFMNAPRAKRG